MATGLAMVTGASTGTGFELAKLANRVLPDSAKAVASRLISLPVGRN